MLAISYGTFYRALGIDRHSALREKAFVFPLALAFLVGSVALTVQSAAIAADLDSSEYLGARRCKLCHDRKPDNKKIDPSDDEFHLTEFVQLTEFNTWYREDKHARAYKVLEATLGKQIGTTLGIEVTKDKSCLSCHVTLHSSNPNSDHELKQGVTCESCHGPSKRWFVPHMDPSWRAKTSQEKERLGMVDVRTPVKRAKQCFSCHIGNASNGKFVTHEMYAAGHPPLPGIEIETFLRKMPPHWKPLSKKSERIKKLFNFDPNELSRTKSVILSGALALRESVNLIAMMATATAAGTKEKTWPNFAHYECYACHHDLKLPSWRQQRGYRGKPGHLQIRDWPEALVELGIFHATRDNGKYQEKKNEYRRKLKRLHEAINTRLFGDPEKIGNPARNNTASGELIAWLDTLITELKSSRYDQTTAIQSLRQLWKLGETDRPEYDAYPSYDYARQIAWATISIYGDLKIKPEMNNKINQIFKELKDVLNLDLQSYPNSLKASADYDPRWFKGQLIKLTKLLPQ